MRFLKLSILASVLFFGTACAQETPKAKLEKTANYSVTIAPDFPDGGINGFRQLVSSKSISTFAYRICKENPTDDFTKQIYT